jgi:hypothetical protein
VSAFPSCVGSPKPTLMVEVEGEGEGEVERGAQAFPLLLSGPAIERVLPRAHRVEVGRPRIPP